MKEFQLKNTDIYTNQMVLGCMRINEMSVNDLAKLLQVSLDNGMNFFDHADIYGGGKSEIQFSRAMNLLDISRDKYYLQSKVGIRQGYFDFSYQHIIQSVDQILKRLNTEYIDVLLLHRPDVLMEGEEVAKAFDQLFDSGKVRYFGVSNHNPSQIERLNSYLNQPLIINQVQFGPAHTGLIDEELFVNMALEQGDQYGTGILSFSEIHQQTIQAWSPYQVTLSDGLFMRHPSYQKLTKTIQDIASNHNLPFEAIVMAWIMRHPTNIMPIIGSTNLERVKNNLRGNEIILSREEWYAIYQAQGRQLP